MAMVSTTSEVATIHSRKIHELEIVSVGAARKYAHDGIVELDPDFHDRGAADGIDPERQPDLFADLVRQRRVKLREERLRARRRQLRLGQEIDHEAEPILRDAAELRAIGALRIGLIDVDQRCDLARHRRRQVIIDHAPLPLDEHERDHRLQHHHRHDDDEQRAGIEPLRQHSLEPKGEACPTGR